MDQSRKPDDDAKNQKGKKRTRRSEAASSAQEQFESKPTEIKKKMKNDNQNKMPDDDVPDPRNARVMPPQFKKCIKDKSKRKTIGEEILVTEKVLSATDVNVKNAFLHLSSTLGKFLNDHEKNELKKRTGENDGRINEIKVPIIEPSLEKSYIGLRRWSRLRADPPEREWYVLANGWHDIVIRNNLKHWQIVQVWAVRVGKELWFALVNTEKSLFPGGNDSKTEASSSSSSSSKKKKKSGKKK